VHEIVSGNTVRKSVTLRLDFNVAKIPQGLLDSVDAQMNSLKLGG